MNMQRAKRHTHRERETLLRANFLKRKQNEAKRNGRVSERVSVRVTMQQTANNLIEI